MSDRERARLEWRSRVDAAARAWEAVAGCSRYGCRRCIFRRARTLRAFMRETPDLSPPDDHWNRIACDSLTAALASPKPWRSSRKPDARRRYSRSHRRGCWRCETVRGPRGILWYAMMRLSFGLTVLDPHGTRRTR